MKGGNYVEVILKNLQEKVLIRNTLVLDKSTWHDQSQRLVIAY